MGYYPHPTEIEYQSAADLLRMVFSDDYVCVFPTVYLRGYCPCAHCQGHSGGPAKWVQPTSRKQVEVVNIQQVGNYALTITWGDGHDSGIYSFQLLRKMDPQLKEEGIPAHERFLE